MQQCLLAMTIEYNNRLLANLSYKEEFEGNTEHRTAAYILVREDASRHCCVDQFRLSNLDSQIQNLKIHIFLHET